MSLCFYSFVACFNFLVNLIQSLIGKRILVDEVSYNDKEGGGNDAGEYQDGILCNIRIVGQLGVLSIYWCADERCQEHHHKDAQHQLETLVGLEFLPHLTE